MRYQQRIVNRINSLNEIDDIEIMVSDEKGTIDIKHRLKHAANFRLRWIDDNHYVGYFIDADDCESQAIVSIWNDLESIKFVSMYLTLVELRAKRENF